MSYYQIPTHYSFSTTGYKHHTEYLCIGYRKDRVVGAVAAIFAISLGILAGFLLRYGYSSSPTLSTACTFGIAALGLFVFSVVMLCRKSEAVSRKPMLKQQSFRSINDSAL